MLENETLPTRFCDPAACYGNICLKTETKVNFTNVVSERQLARCIGTVVARHQFIILG
jgi:hypothetical protein